MADLQKLVRLCRRCVGSGEETIGNDPVTGEPRNPITCRKCGGEGEISTTWLHPDLIALFVDMNDKIDDILERVSE